jgi:hypothetical protein
MVRVRELMVRKQSWGRRGRRGWRRRQMRGTWSGMSRRTDWIHGSEGGRRQSVRLGREVGLVEGRVQSQQRLQRRKPFHKSLSCATVGLWRPLDGCVRTM